MEEEMTEEEREKYVLAISLKVLWTSLIILVLIGTLIPLTIFLGWWKFYILCFLGLLAGIAITAGALISPQSRALITLLLGALTLPALALYLSNMAVRSHAALNISSAVLFPFVVYALGTMLSGLWIGKIWQKQPLAEEETPTTAFAETKIPVTEAEIERKEARPAATEESAIKAEEGVETV
jgi:hypothetical protein